MKIFIAKLQAKFLMYQLIKLMMILEEKLKQLILASFMELLNMD